MRKMETYLFIELTVVVLCLCRRLLVHRVILDVLSSRHFRLFLLVSHVICQGLNTAWRTRLAGSFGR
jgi:hypothetical protein